MSPAAASAAVQWRRLDRPGRESARLLEGAAGPILAGVVVVAVDRSACCLRYRIACDPAWRTRRVEVSGWIGGGDLEMVIEADSGEWQLDGRAVPALRGCTDVDLAFSPATNLLPIRRLALAVGASRDVEAAWLRFPELRLERLEQTYRRLDETRYRYESRTGFACELVVDEAGLVIDYPGVWEREAP